MALPLGARYDPESRIINITGSSFHPTRKNLASQPQMRKNLASQPQMRKNLA